MIDIGSGPPIVLIPGIQGRWEWMQPAVTALATLGRVISFSLCGEPGAECRANAGDGFDRFIHQIDRVLDRANVAHATVCGVSFGGLIALRYAAHRPDRITSLVLVSTPSPSWQPECRIERYLRAPRLMAPMFVAGAPARLWPEIAAAFPDWRQRLAFAARHTARVARSPIAPTLMAERIRLAEPIDFVKDCESIDVPTLVITGEPGLDRVVTTGSSREYLGLIRGSTSATLVRTGHIGLVTRPDEFTGIVRRFVGERASSRPVAEPLGA